MAESLECHLLALVGHEAPHQQVPVLDRFRANPKAVDVHGRIDHLGGATVVVADASRDGLGDGHEAPHPVGTAAAHVPGAETTNQRGAEGAPETPTEIGVGLIPDVPHRREAAAEVRRVLRGSDALGDGVARREHEVVALEAKALDRPGVERKQLSVVPAHPGQTGERARVDLQALDARGGRPRYVEEGVEIGIGKQRGVLVEDPFPAAQTRQPIVDQSDPHGDRG